MADDTPGDAPEQKRQDNPTAPRQRRRFDAPAEPAPAPSDAGTPGPADVAPPPAEPAPFQRRRSFGDSPATPPAQPATPPQPPPPPPPPQPVPPPAQPAAPEAPAPEAPPAKDKKPAKSGDGISPARRAIRIVLLLVLIGAAAGFFLMVLNEMDAENNFIPEENLPTHTPLPPNPEGEELAAELFAQIRAGKYASVLERRDRYVGMKPLHPQVLRAVYLAEAVDSVGDAYRRLAEMPPIEADSGQFLAVEERLQRIVPRMAMLNRMEEYRTDWGDELLEIPEVAAIFEGTREEAFLANRRVTEWRRYQSDFESAFNDLIVAAPNYDDIAARLEPLAAILSANGVNRLRANILALKDGQQGIASDNMHAANDALSLIKVREVPGTPQGIEDRLEALIRERKDKIAAQFASWRRLWEESEKSLGLYRAGDMAEAVGEIQKVVANTTPDSPASRNLHEELTARSHRWAEIAAAYSAALSRDKNGSIPERMIAWQRFAVLLNPEEDAWQVRQAIDGAQRIKKEFNANVEAFQDDYAEAWSNFEPIESKLRQPATPREEFATPAAELRRLSMAAEEVLRSHTLGQGIELTAKSRAALSVARQILAEQGSQAQSLWNLGRLYRDRGEIPRFRECLERIILLGENQSNPFYVEARNILSEENAEQ